MRARIWINVLRPLAGLLVLVNVVGMLFFTLGAYSLIYGWLGIVAMGVFCFLPRSRLARVWAAVAALAVLALMATLVVACGDIFLVNGPDYPALAIRSVEVGILLVMFAESRAAHAYGARR